MTQLLAAVIVASLALYVISGGADYGAGVWDLLSGGPFKEEQKELIANAIRPIWEANHIWLILILVLLFSGFPRAFSSIMVALFIPILVMLLGIILRGSSFVVRAYSTINSSMQRTCAYLFSVASCITPFFFGIVLGSLSDDRVVVVDGVSMNGYLLSWLNPFPITVGLFALALFAFLAATYLTVEAPTSVCQSFRNRAIGAGVIASCLATLAFILTAWYAREFRYGLLHTKLARCSEIAAGMALIVGVVALFKNRFRLARIMAAMYAGAVVVVWAAAHIRISLALTQPYSTACCLTPRSATSSLLLLQVLSCSFHLSDCCFTSSKTSEGNEPSPPQSINERLISNGTPILLFHSLTLSQ